MRRDLLLCATTSNDKVHVSEQISEQHGLEAFLYRALAGLPVVEAVLKPVCTLYPSLERLLLTGRSRRSRSSRGDVQVVAIVARICGKRVWSGAEGVEGAILLGLDAGRRSWR